MISEVIKCDRCGKNIPYPNQWAKIFRKKHRTLGFIPDYNQDHPIQNDIDLCKDCCEDFWRFMKNKGVYR